MTGCMLSWVFGNFALESSLLMLPKRRVAECVSSSSGVSCKSIYECLPPTPTREYADAEIAARAVMKDILQTPPIETKTPKFAFMFLTPDYLLKS
ncbi:hypothetical protein C5167_000660 [Papaver somniferum]|uniref:Uncharacterized protein n=1 Tax=Papaver somniferum TaxID=3469 RepID=A0A4Y7KWK1_PAPSO|nr:hypothetical protein C5167_000660 [Papaver somniferum]